MADSGASVDAREAGGELVIGLKGAWTVRTVAALDQKMAAIKPGNARLDRGHLLVESSDRAHGPGALEADHEFAPSLPGVYRCAAVSHSPLSAVMPGFAR